MMDMEQRDPIMEKPQLKSDQSIQEQLDRLIDGKYTGYVMAMILVVFLTGIEWYRWYFHVPLMPILATVVTLGVLLFCIPKVLNIHRQAKSLILDRDGDKEVGEYLEHLRRDGCIVFHDITGDNFNLDHVILSTKGIYAVETRTYSKPLGNGAKINYDGEHLDIDGFGNQDDILLLTKAECLWLRGLLRESTGREFSIKPVVMFPGWQVESRNHDKHWVLNPESLPQFIQDQEDTLTNEDVQLAAYHLSRYIGTL